MDIIPTLHELLCGLGISAIVVLTPWSYWHWIKRVEKRESQRGQADQVQRFICYMIDHSEGVTVSEESLQWAYAMYLQGTDPPCPCGSGRKYKRCCGEE